MGRFFSHLGTDFASILFVLAVVTGVLWTLDVFWLEKRRKAAAPDGVAGKANWLVDFGRQFFPVIAAVFLQIGRASCRERVS
jgi:signal peptidase I